MKIAMKLSSLASLAVLLSACGGSSTESPSLKSAPQAMRSAAALPASAYADVVQSLYMGFFGRPADPQGLSFWSTELSNRNLPATIPELIAGYAGSADIKAIVDAFAESPESKSLYVSNNASFINAVYLNVFNRNAEAAGREFWSGFLDRNEISRAQAVLWILSGGQNDDATVTAKKIQAATILTSLLVKNQVVVYYSGDRANEAARALLGAITATTDMSVFRAEIEAFVASLNPNSTFPTITRYFGYHYLQDMSNAPAYAASFSQTTGGVVGPANTGKLSYGVTPQTVTWSRDPVTRVLTFTAPVVAGASLPATDFPPAVSMLCTAVPGANGNVTKSTDVLVARSARQLLDAAELAGQTLSVYREDCAIGGNHVQSFVFDAAGNGTFPSATGVLTMDAKLVTSALNGKVLLDISTGKHLVFSAYRYSRLDGTTGYAIVQHLGNHLTGVNDGVLAVWSQE
jgi:hypothetical protein